MKKNKRVKLNLQKLLGNISFVFAFIVIIVIATSNVSAKREFTTTEVRVASSDTLWSIAGDISDKSKSLNIQKVIYDIQEINGLKNSDIFVGQVLQIPVY